MNFENYKMPTEVEAGLFALCNQKKNRSLYTETWCYEIDSSMASNNIKDYQFVDNFPILPIQE